MLTAKGGCNPPWNSDFPTDFICEIVHEYVSGVKESIGGS